jgi:type IV pilus assembly protein PilE
VRLPKIHAALRDQRGMTLIELVVVILIIAILLVIATSSYLGYRERANDSAAQASLHNVVPSIQGYYVDHESYAGMTLEGLRANYDSAIDPALYSFGSSPPTDTTYCIHTTSGGRTWRKNGPTAELERMPCP